jgi:hypothetical protein
LGLWTTNLNLEKTYSAVEEPDDGAGVSIAGSGQSRRRAGMWITDAIYMPDAHKLVLASTSRDLRFFTISTEIFLEEYIIFGKSKNRTKYENFRFFSKVLKMYLHVLIIIQVVWLEKTNSFFISVINNN